MSEHNEKALDLENLKEEIDNLGKEKINEVHSFLKQIIIHIKTNYNPQVKARLH
ncbi:DUF29 family protein [Okeania sp. SIO2C2]|uniref:DUF29 family protein n=1 Tax=Okeania sp. SIO2C2 TaxID=2607787 RepID=UPI00338DCBEC